MFKHFDLKILLFFFFFSRNLTLGLEGGLMCVSEKDAGLDWP